MTSVQAIKKYFESSGASKITMAEMKALTHEERQELGALACEELGEEFNPAKPRSK